MNLKSLLGTAAIGLFLLAGQTAASAMAKCVTQPRKPPYTVAWADIYLAPTWMTQTTKTMNDMAADLKKAGLLKDFTIQNANGNVTQQIQQIQAMIDANTDVIIVDAGSPTPSTAWSPRHAARASPSSPSTAPSRPTTSRRRSRSAPSPGVTRRRNGWSTSSAARARSWCSTGPAGIGVSEARWAAAKKTFDANPGIQIAAISNTEYNAAPAEQSVSSLLYAHPDVDGIWSQGGALSAGAVLAYQRAGKKIPPMTGENSKQFLKMWSENKLDAMAVGNPNWMGAMAILAGVDAQQGKDVVSPIDVPIPVITNDNLAAILESGKEFPDDGFIYPPYTMDSLQAMILKK